MQKYMVLKAIGLNARRVCLVNLSTKAKISATGNIPQFFHGMIVDLEVRDGKILNYAVEMNAKNRGILEKNEVDVSQYAEAIEIHQRLKKLDVSWKIAKSEMEQIYNNLPFRAADKVHKEMVNDPTDMQRLEALKREVLDTGRRHRTITYGIDEYLSYFDEAEREGAYKKLMVAVKILCLKDEDYTFERGRVIDVELKQKEDYIRGNIAERKLREYTLLSRDEIEQYKPVARADGLADEQIAVLDCLETSRPSIVTGGAGSGKTTVIKAVIGCYTQFYKKTNILLVAPTGKAARRLAEKTGLPAGTIHKALRKNPEDDYTYYTEKNKLPYRLVIIDESSMIDTALMYDLLSAVEPSSKVIFVGDHNQLYPVGYGEPFFDFLSNQLKNDVYRLILNHRQEEGTDILKVAEDILADRAIKSGRGVTIRHISSIDFPTYFPDRNDDKVQVISPYNNVNNQINVYMSVSGTREFSVGDKVMTIKNAKKYSNGDIGIIKKIDKRGITIEIDGKNVLVAPAYTDDVVYAYAITVHKMQGSEADKIVCFVPEDDAFLVDKRFMYTAVTRAKKELEINFYTK